MIESSFKSEKKNQTHRQILEYLGARELFHDKTLSNLESLSMEEVRHLVFELELYQIELTMQKDDLLKANAELENMRDLYFNLFELSPAGYLIVDREGYILQSNIAAQNILSSEDIDINHRNLSSLASNIIDIDAMSLVLKTCAETRKLQEFQFFNKRNIKIYAKIIPAMINDNKDQEIFLLTLFNKSNTLLLQK